MVQIIGFGVKRYEAGSGLKEYYADGNRIAYEKSQDEQAHGQPYESSADQ